MSTHHLRKRQLLVQEILAWAEAYHHATGKWPTKNTGIVAGSRGETWLGIDHALRDGLRGLPGGRSLAQLLAEERHARNLASRRPLSEEQILTWADAHHQRTGTWPTRRGPVHDAEGENWRAIDMALRVGARGLGGGGSLAQLLAERRGVRNRKRLPPLTEEQILSWADGHHNQTGTWPIRTSGPIPEAPGETWMAADMALRKGLRGLPAGSSLALLLADKRAIHNAWTRPDLSILLILSWVDAWHERTGQWPLIESGPIPEAPNETWNGINHALRQGDRGLPGGSSLARLLAVERGVRNQVSKPRFRRQRILAWADAHHRRTGQWPTAKSGPIPEAPEETWQTVDVALKKGFRGLPSGSSLARFLAQHRGKRNHVDLSPLSQKKILAWADAHHERTGQWPNINSADVEDAPGERWDRIDSALRDGQRGLSGGYLLLQLLVRKRDLGTRCRCPRYPKKRSFAGRACTFNARVLGRGTNPARLSILPETRGPAWTGHFAMANGVSPVDRRWRSCWRSTHRYWRSRLSQSKLAMDDRRGAGPRLCHKTLRRITRT